MLFLTNAAKLDLMEEGLKRIKNLQITKKFVAWIDIIFTQQELALDQLSSPSIVSENINV